MDKKIARAKVFSPKNVLIKIHMDLFEVEKRVVREWQVLPLSHFEKLVLVLEDHRFFGHRGVDWISCLRELIRAVSVQKYGGASTIDMQFVRTATGYKQHTLRRKLYEMLLAWLIQFRYDKYTILRSYLNCAFFGSHLIGATRPSYFLFGRSPDELAPEEASLLAAMLVYPRPLQPAAAWETKLRRRANYAIRRYGRLKQRFDKLPRPKPMH